MAGNTTGAFRRATTVAGPSLPGESFTESYRRLIASLPARGENERSASCPTWTDRSRQEVWTGLPRGYLVWMRTVRAGSQLLFDEEVVGDLGARLNSGQLRIPLLRRDYREI